MLILLGQVLEKKQCVKDLTGYICWNFSVRILIDLESEVGRGSFVNF